MVTAEEKGLVYCCQGLCCLLHAASASKYFLPLGLRESLCREGYPVNLAGQKQETKEGISLATVLVSKSFCKYLERAVSCHKLCLCIGHGYEVI